MNLTEDNVLRVVNSLFKSCDEKPRAKTNGYEPKKKRYPPRTGDSTSYHYAKYGDMNVERLHSHRCFRVLTYRETSRGQKQFINLMDGSVVSRGITKNGSVYETRRGALGEKFPPNQYGHSKSGCGISPRVLVAFECWGNCQRRYGGGVSSRYEFVKCIGIVECLDPIYPHPQKHATAPVAPNFFPKRDMTAPPRTVNRRSIRVQRAL